jgi:hypothetical protein
LQKKYTSPETVTLPGKDLSILGYYFKTTGYDSSEIFLERYRKDELAQLIGKNYDLLEMESYTEMDEHGSIYAVAKKN